MSAADALVGFGRVIVMRRLPLWSGIVGVLAVMAVVLSTLTGQVVAADTQPGAVDPAFAQTFTAMDGEVEALARQSDGKILVGGNFTYMHGTPAPYLARLMPDGTRDTSFNLTGSGFDAEVMALAIQPDGKILVAGWFNSYDGAAAPFLTRLNSDGSRDTSFAQPGSGLNSWVYGLALQPDGKIVVGGWFTEFDGLPVSHLMRFNSDGTRDTSFVQAGSGLNASVSSVLLQPDGKVLVAGWFSSYDGVAAQRVIRFNTDGTRDTSFTQTGTGLNNAVEALVLQGDGKIVAGGQFTSYDGGSARYLIRLNPNGTRDSAFVESGTGLEHTVWDLALQPDGKILASGDFTDYDGAGEPYLMRFNTDGTPDTSFDQTGTGLNSGVLAVLLLPDGSVVAGGYFEQYDTQPAQHLLKLTDDGSLEPAFIHTGNGLDAATMAVAVQEDGKILVGGWFTFRGNAAAPYLVRLNPDGTRDPSFNQDGTGLSDGVTAIAVQPDGKILVGGYFDSYDGAPAQHLIRLNVNGSRDTSFALDGSGLDDVVFALAPVTGGKILVGGGFATYNGLSTPYLLRLNENGSRDTGFDQTGSGLDSAVSSLVPLDGGGMLIGGYFTTYNGSDAQSIIRLNADGSRDGTFSQTGTGLSGTVEVLAVQPDGKILAGGWFDAYNGTSTPYLVRLTANGALDASFEQTGSGLDAGVDAVLLQPDGKVLVAGAFSGYNGSTANPFLMRLNADGGADGSFAQTGSGFDKWISDAVLQPDGKLVVAGGFMTYDSAPYAYVARILSPSADPSPSPTPTTSPTDGPTPTTSPTDTPTPTPTPVAPDRPTKVKASANTKRVKVSWKAASGATSYSVSIKGKNRKKKSTTKKKTTTATTKKVKVKLKKGTKFKACVAAKNSAGSSAKACVKGKVKKK